MSDRCLKAYDDEGEIVRCELDAGHATNHISGDWIWAEEASIPSLVAESPAPLPEEAATLCPTCESMNHEVRQTCLIPERGKWTGIKHGLRYICADPWHESVVFSEEAPTPTDQRMPTDQEEVAAQEFFTTRGSFGAAMVSWEIACRMAALYGLWVKRGAAFSEEAARREFEEWAKIHYPSADLVSDTDGYWNTLVRCSWEGWLACAKKRAEG